VLAPLLFSSGMAGRFDVVWALTGNVYNACLVRVQGGGTNTFHRSGAWGWAAPCVSEILAQYAAETRVGSLEGLLATLERMYGVQQQTVLAHAQDSSVEEADGWVTECAAEGSEHSP
jgi:hypothetical protein